MIQFLAQWNGYEADAIYSLDSAEESRLVAAGLARYYSAGMDGKSTSCAVFVPPTQDYLGIMIAHSAAVAAGGGTVALSGYYDLTQGGTNTNPLPVTSGITYAGTGVIPKYAGIFDAPETEADKGTVLDCKGVMTAFAANNTPLTNAEADALYGAVVSQSPASSVAAFGNSGISSFHARDFGIKDPIYGFHVGALNRCGLLLSSLSNIVVEDAREWGLWIENYMHCDFNQVFSFGARVGQQMWAASCGRYISPGNSYANKLFGIPRNGADGKLARGIVVMSYNNTIHGLDMGHVQVNRFNRARITQTATFNGTSAVGVTDLAEFPVNMSVAFAGCSAYGFADNQLYFVKSRSASTGAGSIVLSNVQGNFETGKPVGFNNPSATVPADVVATGSGSVASGIYCLGFPNFEFLGLDTSGTPCDATMIDSEGEGTCSIYLQRSTQPRIRSANVTYSTDRAAEICLRETTYGVITARFGARYDADASSNGNVISGFRQGVGQRGIPGVVFRSDTSRAVMNLATNYGTGNQAKFMSLENRQPSGGDFTYPGTPIGQKITGPYGNTTFTPGAGYAGCIGYSGSTAATWTLPEATSDEWFGLPYEIANYGTGTLTVNTTNSQLFNNQAGKTSYSLAPGQFLSVIAAIKPNGGYMWHVRGTNAT